MCQCQLYFYSFDHVQIEEDSICNAGLPSELYQVFTVTLL